MSFYEDYLKKQNSENKDISPQPDEPVEQPVHPMPPQPEQPTPPPSRPFQPEQSPAPSQRINEDIERQKFMERISKGEASVPVSPPLKTEPLPKEVDVPPALTKVQKITVRILVLFLILALAASLAGLVWWWAIKTPQIVTETIIQEKEIVIEVPEIEAPKSFLRYNRFLDPDITHLDEIPVYLKQFAEEQYEPDSLIKVSFKDKTDKSNISYINLMSFFSSMKIMPPSGFYDKIDHEDFNAFVYSGQEGNELGFINPIKEGVINEFLGIVMGTWDATFEKDFSEFYSITSFKNEPSVTSLVHKQTTIRCRNFTQGHHLCYAVRENKFLMTTSLESIKKAIDNFR